MSRVQELFDALADLPPTEAAERLAAEPDVELRVAVAGLLDHDRAAGEKFLEPAVDQHGATLPARRHVSPSKPPARLGRFYVLRKLGAGGMGEVYVGFDEKLDRKVALKLLLSGVATHDWLLREGQALARLAHPNVVAVYEAGDHEGRPFFAMELVEGPTLRAWLETPRPFVERLRLFVEAGRGLEAAHAAGLVHRDFKPDNVLVSPDGRARVVDFGIAALAGTAERSPSSITLPVGEQPLSALSPPLTAEGIIGTPSFMSPEQFRGEHATEKSDQFGFAISLYRAAYGRGPFDGDDAATLSKNVLAGRTLPPPRTSEVPEWLGPILMTALAHDPARRFASMTALLAEIERHLPRDPQLDPSVSRRERSLVIGAYVLAALPIALFAILRGPTASIGSHRALVGIAAVLLAVISIATWVFRRSLSQSKYGKRMIAVLIGAPLALVVHRLVSWRLGVPVAQMVGSDLAMLSALLGLSGVLLERWIWWPAGVMLAGLGWVLLDPSKAVTAMAMAAPLSLILSVYFMRRR